MRTTFHLSLVVFFATAQAQAAQRRDEGGQQPVFYAGEPDALTVTLAADRAHYYVGEAVHLALAIRNETPQTLIGFFIRPERAQTQYRHPRVGSFMELRTRSPELERLLERLDRFVVPSMLAAGETARREITLAAHGTGSLILDQPGEYQFRVLCRPARDHPDHVLSSNVVSVQVDPAPPAHQEALAAYLAEGLPAFIQDAIGAMEARPHVLLKAAEFLDKYPHSPYVEPLRKPLLDVVRDRVLRGKATEREREIYERLEPRDPDHRPPERAR